MELAVTTAQINKTKKSHGTEKKNYPLLVQTKKFHSKEVKLVLS